jgi:hypothetical protein
LLALQPPAKELERADRPEQVARPSAFTESHGGGNRSLAAAYAERHCV